MLSIFLILHISYHDGTQARTIPFKIYADTSLSKKLYEGIEASINTIYVGMFCVVIFEGILTVYLWSWNE